MDTHSEQTYAALASSDLPTDYGTERLFLVARDPHSLLAQWDLSDGQVLRHTRRSADGKLRLRILASLPALHLVEEIELPPRARHRFVSVAQADAPYTAELGCRLTGNEWETIASAAPVTTPPDSLSEDTTVRFERIPPDIPLGQRPEPTAAVTSKKDPTTASVRPPGMGGSEALSPESASNSSALSPALEEALARLVSAGERLPLQAGSSELTAPLRQQWKEEHAVPGLPPPPGPLAPTSPIGLVTPSTITSPKHGWSSAPPPAQEQVSAQPFWLNVSAELVLYGATEPDARVTLGGRTIALRPDGTFTYRVALPDGEFEMPIEAFSADGRERRKIEIEFQRSTRCQGAEGTLDPR